MKYGKQISHTMRGYADGGSVPRARSWKYKLPAFESAAQAAGMDYSMDTVNEMVLLVNEGHTPSSAAKVVAEKRRRSGGSLKRPGTPVPRMVT